VLQDLLAMWWLKSSLLMLVFNLVITRTNATPTISELFNILENGACSSVITDLNNAMGDVEILIKAFIEIIAVSTTSTITPGASYQDGIVARKLFTKYFGIQFRNVDSSGNQVPRPDYREHWKRINGMIFHYLKDLEQETMKI
jgi:hypothetical protein